MADSNSIDGTIIKVLFHKPDKYDDAGMPYVILKLADGTVAKGKIRKPVLYAEYRFFGEMAPQKGGYDDAFEFHDFEPLVSKSVDGVSDYLFRHIDGIGVVKAKALVNAFGDETLSTLRMTPERAAEVEGITDTNVEAIRLHFSECNKYDPAAYARMIDLFKGYHVPRKTMEMILKHFGSNAPDVVLDHPYILLGYPRVGWKTADAFALDKAEYSPSGPDRHEAAVLEAIEQITINGHTCATKGELVGEAEKLLGQSLVDGTLDRMIENRDIVADDDGAGPIYQLPDLAMAEATIADRLADLAESGRPLGFPLVTDEWVAEVGLGEDQLRAARLIESNAVAIITGAPGVGKTYVISRIIRAMQENGVIGIRCCAPTGKAAKRLAELLADAGVEMVPSTTIHKALKPIPSSAPEGIPSDDAKFARGREPFSFGHNSGDPLPDRIVIVDETSMVDAKLMASLLRAIARGTRIIFVGDHNQLPSVRAGSVLRDMIAAGIPTAELTEIRRSDGGGTIVRACHAIKDGIVPRSASRIDLPTENWVHIEIDDPRAIAAKIVELHATTKRFDPMWDMQVVSPQKSRLPIGCENLNRLLSRQLNPAAHVMQHRRPGEEEGGSREPLFQVGDKVVRTKNMVVDELIPWDDRLDYIESHPDILTKNRPDMRWNGEPYVAVQTPVVNGDMGTVEDIIEEGRPSVIVRFRDPERLVRLPYADAHITMAYAMTIHKCQGSGFPYVIMPIHNSFYYDQKTGSGLLIRELVYTGISRAEQLLVTVGQWSAFRAAISRKTVNRRRTTLVRRIDEMKTAA